MNSLGSKENFCFGLEELLSEADFRGVSTASLNPVKFLFYYWLITEQKA